MTKSSFAHALNNAIIDAHLNSADVERHLKSRGNL